MAIDRVTLTTYLTTRYGPIALEAGLTTEDEAAGWGPALDAVQATVDLAVTLSPIWYEPLARYYALDLIVARLAANMDVTLTSGASYRLQQLYKNARELLDSERVTVGWIVDPIPPTESSVGSITTWRSEFLTGGEYLA